MPFKLNISSKGKTYHTELESEDISGRKLKEKIDGKDISSDFVGYEFEITGASDKAGLAHIESEEGISLRKVLLTFGEGMKKRPKHEGKRKRSKNRPKGLKLRKTLRGNTLSQDTVQINLKVLKEGSKKLSEIFPDQAQGKSKANRASKRKDKGSKKEEQTEKITE
jgi:small subunit ribosomal protein S6e